MFTFSNEPRTPGPPATTVHTFGLAFKFIFYYTFVFSAFGLTGTNFVQRWLPIRLCFVFEG
jgi:hypothetical protein